MQNNSASHDALLSKIDVRAELSRAAITFAQAGGDEIKILCPWHDDKTPSCSVNTVKNLYHCHVCQASGTVITLLTKLLNQEYKIVLLDLAMRYDIELAGDKLVEVSVIERQHAAIWSEGLLLSELRKRGITDELIRKYRLGANDGRISIPIRNAMQMFVNVRSYLPGASGDKKFKNLRGYGKPRLFPIEQLKFDTVIVCGGELKAIAAAEQLNKHNIGAICVTAGEGKWQDEFTSKFAGKIIYVCMDVDKAGQVGASIICRKLYRTVKELYNIVLPLNPAKYPKGDVNDFIAQEHGDLFVLLRMPGRDEWTPPIAPSKEPSSDEKQITETTLEQILQDNRVGIRAKFQTTIIAEVEQRYALPIKMQVVCQRGMIEACKDCSIAEMQAEDTYTVDTCSDRTLRLIDVSDERLDKHLRENLGIPLECSSAANSELKILERNPVTQLEIGTDEGKKILAFVVGDLRSTSDVYSFTGSKVSTPSRQVEAMLINEFEPVGITLDTYEPHDMPELLLHRPDEWTVDGIDAKLNERYSDLEQNATRVFCRRDIHKLVDLLYHSVLRFEFMYSKLNGWLNVVLLGDTVSAKSTLVNNMIAHYGVGRSVNSDATTMAGLIGGIYSSNYQQMIKWGALPRNDRGLLFIDEAHAMRDEMIEQLTLVCDGEVKITKIMQASRKARVRMIRAANVRDGRAIKDFRYGISAFADFIKKPEDQRRVDAVAIVAIDDVPWAEVRAMEQLPRTIAPRFTPELCRGLVLWAWTRDERTVYFEDEAMQYLQDNSQIFASAYADKIPIAHVGTIRQKLAKFSVALAALTFSSSDDYTKIIVRKCHVEYVIKFLQGLYCNSACAFDKYSREMQKIYKLNEKRLFEIFSKLMRPNDLVSALLAHEKFTRELMRGFLVADGSHVDAIIGGLIACHAIEAIPQNSESKGTTAIYCKTPNFIAYLENSLREKSFAKDGATEW